MTLRHAHPRILGAVVAMLLVALSLGVSPAQASHGGDTHAVEAMVVDNHGNGLDSELDAYQYNADGDYFDYIGSQYAYDGIYTSDNGSALDLPPGEYKFQVYDYTTGQSQWVGGTQLDDAHVYSLNDDLNLGQIVFQTPATVSGTVTRASDGTPVRYADLVLEGSDNSYYEDSGRGGAYRFADVAPGEYTLSVTDNERELAFEPVSVSVGADDVVLNVRMLNRPRITGTIRNSAGTPLRGVEVTAFDEDGNYAQDTVSRTNGTYQLVVNPGTYRVGFRDGLGDYLEQYYNNASDFETAQPVAVAAEETVPNIGATLQPDTSSVEGVDLAGRVIGTDGKNAEGVRVYAYSDSADSNSDWQDYARVNRAGNYRFTHLQTGDYKLELREGYYDYEGDLDYLPFVGVWSGGKQNIKHATTVSAVEDAPSPKQYNVTMQRYGLISGTVKARSGAPALTESQALAVDIDDNYSGYSNIENDSYRMLVPPGTYSLRFDGEHCDNGEDECIGFVREYWDNSPTLAGSRKVSVGSAQRVTGVNAVMTPDLETVSAPTVTGTPVVGNTLTATTGQWNLMAQNTYDYTWLRGTMPVGTGPTYKLVAADAGRPLSVRVDAQHYDLDGTALSAAVTPKRTSSTTVSGSSPKLKTVKLTATVSVPGVSNPGGTVTFYRGAKAIKSSVALTNGVATVTVGSQPRGKQSFSVKYAGDASAVGSSSSATSVKIK